MFPFESLFIEDRRQETSGFHLGPFQILFPFHTHNSHLIGQIHTNLANLVPVDSINVEIFNSSNRKTKFSSKRKTRGRGSLFHVGYQFASLCLTVSFCISLFDSTVSFWPKCFFCSSSEIIKFTVSQFILMVLRERDFKQWFSLLWINSYTPVYLILCFPILLEADSETFATINHFHNQLKVYVAFWRSKVWTMISLPFCLPSWLSSGPPVFHL